MQLLFLQLMEVYTLQMRVCQPGQEQTLNKGFRYSEVFHLVFFPFLIVTVEVVSSLNVTFIHVASSVRSFPLGARASISFKGEYIKVSLDNDEGHLSFLPHNAPCCLVDWAIDTANCMACWMLLLPELFAPIRRLMPFKLISISTMFLNLSIFTLLSKGNLSRNIMCQMIIRE